MRNATNTVAWSVSPRVIPGAGASVTVTFVPPQGVTTYAVDSISGGLACTCSRVASGISSVRISVESQNGSVGTIHGYGTATGISSMSTNVVLSGAPVWNDITGTSASLSVTFNPSSITMSWTIAGSGTAEIAYTEYSITTQISCTQNNATNYGSFVSSWNYSSAGAEVPITVVPGTGYRFHELRLNGTTAATYGGYTSFIMPAADVVATAVFTPISYSIIYKNDTHGTCSGVSSADYNSTVNVTATPNPGYKFSYLEIEMNGSVTPYFTKSFTIIEDAVVTAYYEVDAFSIYFTNSSGHGSVTPVSSVSPGTTVNLDFSPDYGYKLNSIVVTAGQGGSTVSTTHGDDWARFTMPSADAYVTFSFAAGTYTISYTHGTGCSLSGPSSATYGTTVNFTSSVSSGYGSPTYTLNGSLSGVNSSAKSFTMPGVNSTLHMSVTAITGLTVTGSTSTIYSTEYNSGSYNYSYLTATYSSGGSSTNVTNSATWSSNRTSVATVSAGTVTAVGPGTATITATYSGQSDTFTITVIDSTITLDLEYDGGSDIYTNEEFGFSGAYAVEYAGSTYVGRVELAMNAITWSSTNTSRVSIINQGTRFPALKGGSSAGSATITAIFASTWSTTLTITNKLISKYLTVTPGSTTINAGGSTAQLTAKYTESGRTSSTTTVTSSASWSSGNTNLFTVSSSGKVTSKNIGGSARATATYNGYSDYCNVTVKLTIKSTVYSVPTVTLSVEDIPATGGTASSGTVSYVQVKTVTYSDNSTETTNITSGGAISYGTPVTAGLAAVGAARRSVGTLTVSVSLNGQTGNGSATVYQASNTASDGSLIVEVDPSAIIIGETGAVIVTLQYPGGQTSDVTSSASIGSSNNAIFTVDNTTKVITGVGSGTASVTAAYSGLTGSTSVRCGTAVEMQNMLVVNNLTPELGSITISGATDVTADITGVTTSIPVYLGIGSQYDGSSASKLYTYYDHDSGEWDYDEWSSSRTWEVFSFNVSSLDNNLSISTDNIMLQMWYVGEDNDEDNSGFEIDVEIPRPGSSSIILYDAWNMAGDREWDTISSAHALDTHYYNKCGIVPLTSLLGGSSYTYTKSNISNIHITACAWWWGVKFGAKLILNFEESNTGKTYYKANYGANITFNYIPTVNAYVKESIIYRNATFAAASTSTTYNVLTTRYTVDYTPNATTGLNNLIGQLANTGTDRTCYLPSTVQAGVTYTMNYYFDGSTNDATNRGISDIATASSVKIMCKIRTNNATEQTGVYQVFIGDTPIGQSHSLTTTATVYTDNITIAQAIDPNLHAKIAITTNATSSSNYRSIHIWGINVEVVGYKYDYTSDNVTGAATDITSNVKYSNTYSTAITSPTYLTAEFANALDNFYVNVIDSSYNLYHGWNKIIAGYQKIDGTWTQISNMYQNVIAPLEQGNKFKLIGTSITPYEDCDVLTTDGNSYFNIDDIPYITGCKAEVICYLPRSMHPIPANASYTMFDWGPTGIYMQLQYSSSSQNHLGAGRRKIANGATGNYIIEHYYVSTLTSTSGIGSILKISVDATESQGYGSYYTVVKNVTAATALTNSTNYSATTRYYQNYTSTYDGLSTPDRLYLFAGHNAVGVEGTPKDLLPSGFGICRIRITRVSGGTVLHEYVPRRNAASLAGQLVDTITGKVYSPIGNITGKNFTELT